MCVLCAMPFLIAIVHFLKYLSVFALGEDEICNTYFLMYVQALLPFILLYRWKTGKRRIGLSILTSMLGVILNYFFLVGSINQPYIHNYMNYSYTDSFKKMLHTLEKEYCLNSWKKMDYDALMEKYLPLVEEAERNHDEAAYAEVIYEVVYRFYDSHVGVDIGGTAEIVQMFDQMAGNDYGLSLIRVDDGSIIAIRVEPGCEAEKLGIHNGTSIITWDHKDIQEAVSEVECIDRRFPVKENEDVFRPIYLAGKGGDEIEISFLDDDGEKKSVTIRKMGTYDDRRRDVTKVLANEGLESYNFYTCMLDEECGYLRVSHESYNTFLDMVSVIRHGYYPEAMERYAKCIENLKAQGMKSLIIDIRYNTGGYDSVAGALASLFTDEKRHMVSFGYEDSEGYHSKDTEYIFPDGRYQDIPVAVLVSRSCMSAGDGMAKFLGDCPNVTLMGITASSGVNQNTGGKIFLTRNIGVKYPVFLSLDENALPLIDTDDTRTNNIPLDVTIPITRESALQMFSDEDETEKEDYELIYAMEYLKTQKS